MQFFVPCALLAACHDSENYAVLAKQIVSLIMTQTFDHILFLVKEPNKIN